MIKAIVFDLDNCLAPATAVGEALYAPAFAAIRQANRGTVPDAALNAAFHACWYHPLDFVGEKFGFSAEMLAAGWKAFSELDAPAKMTGYADLPVLRTLDAQRFLVTSGFRRLQQSKVDALGLRDAFVAVLIDALGEPGRIGKSGCFAQILSEHRLRADEALVVGDNPDSEIAAGNRLGLATVQIVRPGVARGTNARHYISTLAELPALL